MNKSLLVGLFGFLSLFCVTPIANADTIVTGVPSTGNTVWNLVGSPYIVNESIAVSSGATLTIEPGVVVKFLNGQVYFYINGTVEALGTTEAPVIFTSTLDDVGGDSNGDGGASLPRYGTWGGLNFLPSATATFAHVEVRYAGQTSGCVTCVGTPMIVVGGGTVNFDHVTLDTDIPYIEALSISGGTTTITNSKIREARSGIFINGGSLSVSQSSFTDFSVAAIRSTASGVVHATGNWWGDASGPAHPDNPSGLGFPVIGAVDFTPWLVADPFATSTPPDPTCTENCNSSVMFLPGLQASRLYKDGVLGDNTLWEPNNKGDVHDLYLGTDGKSLDSTIFTKDILDEAFGFGPDIYKTFIEMMDGLKDSGKIVDWSDIPYDWRLTLGDIIDNGTLVDENHLVYSQSSPSPYLFETLSRLASSSRTGKVTIVAHSNGGLVAKALMIRLAEMEKTGLVDKVILVASPQLGTPKAVASLLHGEGQELGGGYLLDKETARGLGKNMPGGYHLLPSAKYFDVVQDAPIIIRQKPSTQAMFNTHGSSTETYGEMVNLLKGTEGRVSPLSSDWETPEVLNEGILGYATDIHNLIDAWIPPLGVEVVEIAGWGRETLKGVRYTDRFDVECQCNRITYVPLFTDEGDETVVVPSALATASTTRYWVDLFEANRQRGENWKHANITEAEPVQQLIADLVTNVDEQPPSFVSTSAPVTSLKKLRYTLHSPLSLGAYDSFGRYSGIGSSSAPGVEWTTVLQEIPNSSYIEFGETKILSLSENEGTITMIGEALGVFTLDVEKIENGAIIDTRSFPDIPVATGTVVNVIGDSASTTLSVDFDANGSADIVIGEDGFTDIDGIVLLKQFVRDLHLGQKQEKRLLGVIQRLEKSVAKDWKKEERRTKRLSAVLDRLTLVIEVMKSKGKVSVEDSLELNKLINILRTEML